MKVESQVASLEQSKRLKELGVKQDSLFYWIDRGEHSRVAYGRNIEFIENLPIYAAFTVAELGEMIPAKYTVVRNQVHETDWWCQIIDKETITDFLEPGPVPDGFGTGFHTEAEARAALLLYLLENKLHTI